MSIEIRSDFRDGGPALYRLMTLAEAFAESDDQWSHLKNQEDFADIYHLARPIADAFERMYAEGRELAGAMARDLVALNIPRRHPTLGSYLDMMDKWAPHLLTLDGVRAAARAELGLTAPWAVRRMQTLFDEQIGMFREVLRVIASLRLSALYVWEAGMTPGRDIPTVARPAEAQPGTLPVAVALGEPSKSVSFLYAHDTPAHKVWVKGLADRLTRDGLHVRLDQYDLGPGDEMALFMEQLVTGRDFKVVVCSTAYVEKTNALKGGAGYEKSILTRSLVKSQAGADIIPVIRGNPLEDPLPLFLGTKMFVDFRNDSEFELRYTELWRKLSGLPPSDRPLPVSHLAIGADRFGHAGISLAPPTRPSASGNLVFNYSNHDGYQAIEAGVQRFNTRWTSASREAIHAYSDAEDIDGIALADGASTFDQIAETGSYDWSSPARTALVNDIVLWRRRNGAILATRIDGVECRSQGDAQDVLTIWFALVDGP